MGFFDDHKDHIARVEWGLFVLAIVISIVVLIISATVYPRVQTYYVNDAGFWNEDREDTVSMTADIIFGIICGLVVLLSEIGIAPRAAKDAGISHWINFRLCLMMAVNLALTTCVTELIKIMVGGLRPAFPRVCIPGQIPPSTYTTLAITSDAQCSQTDEAMLKDYRKSFPSGHTSYAFAAALYLSLYFVWRAASLRSSFSYVSAQVFSHLLMICVSLPLWCALLIGVSRLLDNKHWYWDVIAGAGIGSLFSSLFFQIVKGNVERDYAQQLKQLESERLTREGEV